MTEPMVQDVLVGGFRCLDCGMEVGEGIEEQISEKARRLWEAEGLGKYLQQDGWPRRFPADLVRNGLACGVCRSENLIAFIPPPVPGMGIPYSATERDEDSEYEYAREDAQLLAPLLARVRGEEKQG